MSDRARHDPASAVEGTAPGSAESPAPHVGAASAATAESTATPDAEAPVIAVLCGDERPPGMGPIERSAHVRYTRAEELSEAVRGAEALFVWDFQSRAVPQAWPAADRLRWLHIASAGVDPVMFPELRRSEVTLTNSRGVFDTPIAEYVLGVILTFAKDIIGTYERQRARRWEHRETERIGGKRALVVGTGPIGRAIAGMLRAAGMQVAGVGRTYRSGDPDFGIVYAAQNLAEQAGKVDFVIAIAPLTAATEGMFDREVFAAMDPGARFINVGRGELVVTDDLIAALQAGRPGAAALDVFTTEPLPAESPLWGMANVLVSPHMSGDVLGWHDALVEVFAENFRRWTAGEALANVVDKNLGYVPTFGAG